MTKTSERFRLRGVLLFVAVGALTVTAACGGGGGGDDGGSAEPAQTGASSTASTSGISDPAATVQACDVVTLDELSEVLDREVILDTDGSNEFTCSYLTTGAGPLVFNINVGPASGPADEVIAEVLANFDDAEAVDIGEAGYVVFGGAQVGFIQDGIDYQVNLGGGPGDSDVRDETIAVARLVESKI